MVLLLIWVVAALPSTATAQSDQSEPEIPAWTLQVDPLTTALGFVHIQVEHTLGGSFSLYAGPSLRLFSLPSNPEDFQGYGAEVGLRYYFTGSAPKGWWALVRGVGAYLTTSINGPDETSFGGYVSALGGYTFIFANGILLSGGGGVQYFDYMVSGLGLKGLAPALHTTFGFAF